jgi:PAS domain S-box-containing protein
VKAEWNHYDTQAEEYKVLFDHAPDAVVAINEQNKIVFWNRKAENLFGWPAEDVLGQDLTSKIIPAEFREAHNRGMQHYLATGEVRVLNRTIEVPAINKQEKEFFVALTIAKTQLKGSTAFLAFIRDITEQRNNQLALEQKTKQLERSNRNLEEFAHAASHDLKEPIRKIHLFANRLKDTIADRLNPEEKGYFVRMEAAAERMQHLVDDLLSYSLSSWQEGDKEAVDLNELFQAVLQDLDESIAEKGAKITIQPLPVVDGYPRQLQQLFQNLLSNALKYSKASEPPVIDIHAQTVDGSAEEITPNNSAGNRYHLIKVKDNGIGFEQSHAEQIFGMFQRLHTKSAYEGSGIGLAIVRKAVENHGGYITAESELHKGSTFNVYLPC